MSDKSSKTEKPSPRRRQKAREQGQVARSRDLTNLAASATAIAVMVWTGPTALQRWQGMYRSMLDVATSEPLTFSSPILLWTVFETVRWAVPAMLAAWAACVAVGFAQGGFVLAPEALAFKFERLNPATKLQQLFSISGAAGLLKSLLPFAAMLYVCAGILSSHWTQIVTASMVSLHTYTLFLGSVCFEVLFKCGLVLAVWAGVDYFLTWRRMENDLKMSHQELKEEFKESEGNPAVKGKMRSLQRQVRRKKMVKAVETATVVVTNPTHFAVALKYELDMDVPIVVAKGQDLLAQEIKEVARWHGIPTIENRPLAQALYRSVEIGAQIPAKLYTAVADILAFVFRARAEAARAAAARNRRGTPGNGGQQ